MKYSAFQPLHYLDLRSDKAFLRLKQSVTSNRISTARSECDGWRFGGKRLVSAAAARWQATAGGYWSARSGVPIGLEETFRFIWRETIRLRTVSEAWIQRFLMSAGSN